MLATKKIVAEAAGWPAGEFWQRQGVLVEPVFTSEDAREGALAFAEKRPAALDWAVARRPGARVAQVWTIPACRTYVDDRSARGTCRR